MNRSRFTSVLGGVLVSAFTAGCADTAPTGIEADFAVGDRTNATTPAGGVVNVCAFMPEFFEAGPLYATFSAAAGAGENVLAGTFELGNGLYDGALTSCMEVWNVTGSTSATVSATLHSAPGLTLERIVTLVGTGIEDNVAQTFTGVQTASISGVDNVIGGSFWFKLELADDPPPVGGQGCTPGYWRQEHHFSSWIGYSPNQQFSSVFADAFPGKTLLEVVWLGGGGLNALGRMSVAALLNASSPAVSFDLTTQQVIDAFNAAYASGNKRTIEQQKNLFDFLNNQGCPL
jgi:hypothetical protein